MLRSILLGILLLITLVLGWVVVMTGLNALCRSVYAAELPESEWCRYGRVPRSDRRIEHIYVVHLVPVITLKNGHTKHPVWAMCWDGTIHSTHPAAKFGKLTLYGARAWNQTDWRSPQPMVPPYASVDLLLAMQSGVAP